MTWATHNRAGEIFYEQIGPNKLKIKLVTYTRIDSEADRTFIDVVWGDGSVDSLERDANFPVVVADDVFKNVYTGIHTYPGPGIYIISVEDPNRNEGVNNIPNSVNVPFFIESKIHINPFLGTNNSPVLLNPPVDDACLSSSYIHNPSAFDQEGDSLAYSLTAPKGNGGETVAGYTIPNDVSIDAITGTLTWLNPDTEGEFNFAILVQEYRNGFLIGSIVRDMQVTVKECSNHPPVIKPFNNICIEAGQPFEIIIQATDSDSADAITLTASGGPLTEVIGNLATFPSGVMGIDSVKGTFKWNTQCPHVRATPYQVIFKAEDDDNIVSLIDLATLNITIIGPATKNVSASGQLNGVAISWDPNPCTAVVGYKIYRHVDSSSWQHSTCETGVPNYTGYKQIAETTGSKTTLFFDSTTVGGNFYCYRIVACFPDGAESYSSLEVCAEPYETAPIPTHVDVKITNPNTGEIYIQWNNPKNIDSLKANAPFFYRLYQLKNNISTLAYTSSDLNDTSFTHQNINTEGEASTYYIELIGVQNGNEIIAATSEEASSNFLNITSADDALRLDWHYSTPWENDTFVVLREINPGSLTFIALDTITSNNYVDSNLINGATYCYKVQARGYYTSPHFNVPFINNSQIRCGIPQDNTPPCPPIFKSLSDCENHQNNFYWSIDKMKCNNDLQLINIYYTKTKSDNYQILQTIANPKTDTSFIQTNLTNVAGCYSFSAVDSAGNESALVQEICFDNCPIYQIPNIFTPNGDGTNDELHPLTYKYIKSIDLIIYNRWGQQVFQTNDIDINWDGRNQFTNLQSSSSIYFYKCTVEEIRINGPEKRIINGFIHIVN
jgi:gliding motility-associated-like protein